ncbi:hypothetical protein AB0J35_47940 [Nonomuraea angiospora]
MRPVIGAGMVGYTFIGRLSGGVPAAVEQSAAEDSRFITVEGS